MKRIILFIVLLFVCSVGATTYYFDCEAVDTTGTGTIDAPFKIISQVKYFIAAGDTLMIKGSPTETYDEADYLAFGKVVGWGLTTSGGGKINVVISGYGLVPPIIEQSSGSSYLIDLAHDLEIHNVIIGDLSATGFIRWMIGSIKCYNVIFDGIKAYIIEDEQDSGSYEYAYFYNCQFVYGASNKIAFCQSSVGQFQNTAWYFDHCLFDSREYSTTYIFYDEPRYAGFHVNFVNSIIRVRYVWRYSGFAGTLYKFTNCIYDSTVGYAQADVDFTFTNSYKYSSVSTTSPNHPHHIYNESQHWLTIKWDSPVFGKGTDFLQIGPFIRADGAGTYLGRRSL